MLRVFAKSENLSRNFEGDIILVRLNFHAVKAPLVNDILIKILQNHYVVENYIANI